LIIFYKGVSSFHQDSLLTPFECFPVPRARTTPSQLHYFESVCFIAVCIIAVFPSSPIPTLPRG